MNTKETIGSIATIINTLAHGDMLGGDKVALMQIKEIIKLHSDEPIQLSENNLFALFDKAKQHLKWPKIVIPCEAIKRGKLVAYLAKDGTKINFTDTGRYPDNEYYGYLFRDGRESRGKDRTQAISKVIQQLIDKPLESTKAVGQAFSFCCFCGTEITSKNSLAVGYGPICAEKWGLPWEGMADKIQEEKERKNFEENL